MIHRPCGDLNPRCVCMDNAVCTKHFPKEFQEQTAWCQHGYPKYRRRRFIDDAEIFATDGQQDNRWVVP